MTPQLIQRSNLLLKVLNCLGIAGIIIFSGSYFTNSWLFLGNTAAKGAIVLYVLTLIPGIVVRLNLISRLAIIHQVLMLTRRQIGIATYLATIAHVTFSYILPQNSFLPSGLSNWFGFIALVLFTPLFVTSNNLSQTFLKHNWNLIHKTTHLIIWFILFHLVLRSSINTALILTLVLVTDVLSLLKSIQH